MDPEKAHMYIYNNIFFSYATDGRDIYKDYGGDKAAYMSINNDVKGIKAFNRVDIKGLYTLATAIVDYRGHRLCAQSIIPGILQREQTSTVVYGSIDNGKKISSDPQFHELLCQVGKQLHIKEHTVVSETDNEKVKLCAPVEAKGIIGTDGRKYILDLIRVSPRDTNYTGKENTLTILRPELIDMYCEFQLQQKKREKYEKLLQEKMEKEKQKQQEKEKAQAQGQTAEGQAPTQPQSETPATTPAPADAKPTEQAETENKPAESEESKPEEPIMEEDPAADLEELLKYSFNPNSFCDFKIDATKEEIEEDEKAIQALGSFLKEAVVPSMVEEWAFLVAVPVDGQTLTSVMHSRGINMRYLGYIATIADKIPVIKEVVVREMITRAAKHIFRNTIGATEDFHLSAVVAHLLNCLIGKVTEDNLPELVDSDEAEDSKDKKKKKKKAKTPDSAGPELTLTTEDIWAQITSEVKTRFQYDLPAHSTLQYLLSNAATLRSVCQKVGIQIDAADYDFSVATPFTSDDILNLFPVAKHPNPETADGKNLLEAGKAFLAQGRLDVAYELLTEALAIFHQVYGPMHRDTANCYGNLAMALFHAKDIIQAMDHQQKATIINERVLGLDHHDTAHSYGNLALFCHNMGKSKLALAYIRRALYLGRMICSPNHPDIATTFNNIAMMLQDLQKHKQAINYLLECTRCYENLLGLDNLQVAGLYHAIALAYSQIDQYKEALSFEKKNYNILHTKVGENDLRVIESNFCLKTFTAKAVQAQIETKKTQLNITSQLNPGRLQDLKKEKGGIGKGPSISSTAPSGNIPMGSRPLSEVMNFINEKGATSKSFLQRNQVSAASPSSVFDRVFADENAKKKNKLKKKK
jgi:protein TIF31